MEKRQERLDVLLVNGGHSESREKAKTLIMTGNVFVNGQREDKAGTLVDINATIEIKSNPIPFVSRGGLKLDKALKVFGIDVTDLICMDVGASTGGFTDCLLQNNAKKVYAVDVGYGQLDWKLRKDERVVCMEKTNIRYLTSAEVPEEMDFVTIDVSFISLNKVLIPVYSLMRMDARCVCLIKPQFEAGREKVGKKGVVRDRATHIDVIARVIAFAYRVGFEVIDIDYSPVKGPEGNIEFLLHIIKRGSPMKKDFRSRIEEVVDKAHGEL